MNKKRNGAKAPIAQFVAIIVLSISVFLIVDFGRRAAANYRVQREADRLSQEVEAARQRQVELLARRTYVASDLYVEAVARNELKWGQPGETVIVVMSTPEAVALPTDRVVQTVTVLPVAQSPAEAWWLLFFGQRSLPVDPVDPP